MPSAGWSITPREVQARFAATNGSEPIFRPSDGANAPNLDFSTPAARRSSYSLLLERGLIRTHASLPANAEFTVSNVADPYGFATPAELSLYRRPLPTTNLRFLSDVMWDGRHTVRNQPLAALAAQASDVAQSHEDASGPLADSVIQQVVAFELALTTAESSHQPEGVLSQDGAQGGPASLEHQPFALGVNDPFGADPQGRGHNPRVFTLFQDWASAGRTDGQQAVARGEALFNTRTFSMMVGGLPGTTGRAAVSTTCSGCHNDPNVGNRSVSLMLDTGVADASLRSSDLPLYTLRNTRTGETVQTLDPGRAVVSGLWADVGKFKTPVLRGLAARPPYFHNGSAANLLEVIGFYERRSDLRLSPAEEADLAAFLHAL